MKLIIPVSALFTAVCLFPGILSSLLHHPNLQPYSYPSVLNLQPLSVVQPQFTVIPRPLTLISHVQPLAPLVQASTLQFSPVSPVHVITLSRSVLQQLLAQSDALEGQDAPSQLPQEGETPHTAGVGEPEVHVNAVNASGTSTPRPGTQPISPVVYAAPAGPGSQSKPRPVDEDIGR